MNRQPSNLKAALWMAGWLTAMLVLAIAGRETTRELAVFQIMEMRSVIGLVLLWPLVHRAGGLAAMKTKRLIATSQPLCVEGTGVIRALSILRGAWRAASRLLNGFEKNATTLLAGTQLSRVIWMGLAA